MTTTETTAAPTARDRFVAIIDAISDRLSANAQHDPVMWTVNSLAVMGRDSAVTPVRLHDPETNEELILRPRDAAALIIALQAEHAAVAYELHKVILAIRQGVTADVWQRAADQADPFARDISPKHGYPEMHVLKDILALAYDGEGYAEHVEAHMLPNRDDDSHDYVTDPGDLHGGCEVCGYDKNDGPHAGEGLE